MIEKIVRLGKEVETLWKKERYRKEAFSGVAFQVLKKSNVHKRFHAEDFFPWLLKTKSLPKQLSLYSGFGQPPITLYRNDPLNFLIDIYFWVTPDIAIHSHGFRGAFTILQGKSLHCLYEFPIEENFKDELLLGDLSLKEVALLKEGNVEEIPLGEKFIHQVWHVSFPTLSLVIRTAKWDGPQYTYLKPHLAFRYRSSTPLQMKQMDTLLMLHHTKSPLKERFLESLVSTSRPHVGLMYLKRYLDETHDLKTVTKILKKNSTTQKYTPYLLKSFQHTHETWLNWQQIQNEKERLFLSLLQIFTEKKKLAHFLRTYFSEKRNEMFRPAWLEGLLQQKKLPFQLNETAMEVFKLLLRGYSEEEVSQRLSGIYSVKNSKTFQKEIHTFCRDLRSIELLKGLFP